APRTRSMTKTLFDSLELKKMSPFMRTFSQSVYRVTISQADNTSSVIALDIQPELLYALSIRIRRGGCPDMSLLRSARSGGATQRG
ncbi:MAG: hypothetical protein AB1331_09005, partial [Bacillota bacterium]